MQAKIVARAYFDGVLIERRNCLLPTDKQSMPSRPVLVVLSE